MESAAMATAARPQDIGPTVEAADIAAASAGDRVAFERLYRRHAARVYSLCLRMTGNVTRAEELTQDVFVRLWEKLPLFRAESAFTTWMHSVAVNVVLSARKTEALDFGRRAEQGNDGEDAMETWDAAAGPDKVSFSGERIDLERAIARLPAGARRVFVLHDVEGYKHEELAGMLGTTTGGSKAQLHRARLLLRKALMS
ncbi:MAG: RNA polymerase sigma factor [Gemmatimonadaceae bacterium]